MRSALIASIAALGAAALALVLAVVALGDDGGGSTDELEQRIQDLAASQADIDTAMTTAQVTAAMGILDGTGFHEIDEEMQVASEIPAGLEGDVKIARQVATAIQWPSELQEHAGAFLQHAGALETALRADDLQTAKAESAETHAAWHELHEAAYPYLAGEQPETDGEHEPGAGHGE